MTRREFDKAVKEAMEGLPEGFRSRLKNISVIVQDAPSPRQSQRVGAGGGLLFGLYEGVPYSERGQGYTGALPDRITIFKSPIEKACRTREEVVRCIRDTVLHEVGHYFGMNEDQLEDLGYYLGY
ncbi:MAG: metallopeptidase family protein [Planctomycetota bacterium]|jgi:predicted Zn-dependent protease with MMP-like domain